MCAFFSTIVTHYCRSLKLKHHLAIRMYLYITVRASRNLKRNTRTSILDSRNVWGSRIETVNLISNVPFYQNVSVAVQLNLKERLMSLVASQKLLKTFPIRYLLTQDNFLYYMFKIHTVVSGALDRLHYERDPCVKYDSNRKVWIYLHRNRSEEEFGKIWISERLTSLVCLSV